MTRLIDVARLFLHVREIRDDRGAGTNRGLRVEAIQKWAGGQSGDSWCMEWVWMCVDLFTGGRAPIAREQVCHDLLTIATRRGWLVPEPQIDDIALSVDANGHAYHVGIVTNVSPLTTIAGNTSEDGRSANGVGVFEHEVSSHGKRFVRLPLPGVKHGEQTT